MRAERAWNQDGRVYHGDGAGGSCTGSVSVCVPRDGQHRTCGDGGPI